MNMKRIVSPLIDEHLTAIARLRFFQRRLEIARKFRIELAIRGYEAHVGRALDLLWVSQQRLEAKRGYLL